MAARRTHRRHFSAAANRRELGFSNYMPNLSPLLGGLRTTPSDEYGFWTVSPSGVPSAIPPFTLSFSSTALDGHALLAADEEGILTVLDTRRSLQDQMHAASPEDAPVARFRGHDNAIFDAVWLPGDVQVATASGDGSARVFDIGSSFRIALLRGHAGSVKCVRSLPDSPHILLTAARDGHVRAYDIRVPAVYNPSVCREVFHNPVYMLERPHVKRLPPILSTRKRRRIQADPPAGSVTSLAFMPGQGHLLFTAGAADGTVKLWDVRGSERRRQTYKVGVSGLSANCVASATPGLEATERENMWSTRRTHGIASLDVDSNGRYLAASATDSTIYLYEAADLGLGVSKRLVGHTHTSFYIRSRFSGCGDFLVSGSADSSAYIWDLTEASEDGAMAPYLRLDGHRGGETAGVAWCKSDGFKLATSGDDATAKVWRVDREKRALRGAEAVRVADEPLQAACEAPYIDVRRRAGLPDVGDEQIDGRATQAGVQRRRLVDADIRHFFGNEPDRGEGREVAAARS